ncbi:MAG TPA: methylated-DNA--[protein]-cysteine S-methyltransferase [Streptosporangiaceae bacterium]|jgi:O-6-methylguanine DNA methyltransferase
MNGLSWASLSTPVGLVSVGCSQAGVARVRYGPPAVLTSGGRGASDGSSGNGGRRGAVRDGQHSGAAASFADAARAELLEYFRGERRAFAVPVDWASTDGPRGRVLTVLVETVGYGETISYGALARRSGLPADPASARAVGSAMAANPVPIIVPCHRVLASDGLGGYSGGDGVEVKRWLLILEGSHPPTLDWHLQGAPEVIPAAGSS